MTKKFTNFLLHSDNKVIMCSPLLTKQIQRIIKTKRRQITVLTGLYFPAQCKVAKIILTHKPGKLPNEVTPVSYTHLDVYKRQL